MNLRYINKRSAYILLICLAFSVESVLRYVEQIFARLPIIGSIYPVITPVIFIILILLSWNYVTPIKQKDLLFCAVFFLLLAGSYLFVPANREFIEGNLGSLIFTMLPFYFLGKNLEISDEIKNALFRVSEIAIVIAWLYLLYYYSSGRALGSDAMYESYTLIVHTLIMMWAAFEKTNPIRIGFVIAGILYALSMGTRGPIVIIIAFFGYLLFKKSQSSFRWKVLILLIASTAAVILTNKEIMYALVLFLKQIVGGWGFSTRIFDDYLFDVARDSLDERTIIYETLIRLFKENPFGYGLYGEYPFVGWSAHNIYLQTMFEFGCFLGPLFMVYFVVIAYKAISGNRSSNNVIFTWLWLCYIIPQGFFGGNIISFYMFFTIGFMIGQNERKMYLTEREL